MSFGEKRISSRWLDGFGIPGQLKGKTAPLKPRRMSRTMQLSFEERSDGQSGERWWKEELRGHNWLQLPKHQETHTSNRKQSNLNFLWILKSIFQHVKKIRGQQPF